MVRRRSRPRLGDEEKPISGPELRTLVEHLAHLAVLEERRGVRRGPRRRDQLMVELLALTGLRASELARLQISDVHLAAKRSYLRVRGGKARGLQEVDTVPVPWDLVSILEKWTRGRPEDEFLVHRARGTPIDRHEIWRVLKRAMRACGLREGLNVHSLRHFFISTVAHAHLVGRFATVGPLTVPGRRRRKAQTSG